MELSKETIRGLTVGAAEIWEEHGCLCFSKTTAEQTDAWVAYAPRLEERVRATTGVRLDFITDSPFLRVVTAGGRKFEVLVDGLLSERYYPAPGDPSFESKIGEGGEHRVTLVFPSHGEAGRIASVSVADGASVRPVSFRRRFLFLGDSITQGWNAAYDSQSFAWLLSLWVDAESINQGVGGGVFIPETVTDFGYRPDTVFVEFGTNDFASGRTADRLRETASESFSRVASIYRDARIYAITPTWRTDGEKPRALGSFDDCRRIVSEAAEEAGISVIDGYSLYPHKDLYMADSVHPNDLGFAHYAANIFRILIADGAV
ncbi:MAG: SGNH/GDSL hydrolase family protein [Clostridia bacterium]|nr:SGNH/GDSL hydrolase family protein [Clostridia bacterium]